MKTPLPNDEAPLTPGEILGNLGLLKLELMRCGVQLEGSDDSNPTAHAFGHAADLDLILPENTWVTAPVASVHHTPPSPFLRRLEGKKGELTWSGEHSPPLKPIPVQLPSKGRFGEAKTQDGVPILSFGSLHGNFLALSPIGDCQYVGQASQCKFCSLPAEAKRRIEVDDILEAIRVGREDRKVEMVFLNVGVLGGDDRGIRSLEPYIRAIKKTFDILVAVDALPPANNAWIDRTYAMGVDSISYNLEVFSENRFQELCPGLAQDIGRTRFLDALAYAATVFPPGAVISHLIVGAEPLESTQEGIATLIDRKVVPVLPVYRPFKGIDLRVGTTGLTVPSTRQLSALYGTLYQQLKQARIPMSWVQQISAVTTPAEGRFFIEESGLTGLLQKLSPLGKGAPSSMLSDWRRSLRVKEVDDSLKSSGL